MKKKSISILGGFIALILTNYSYSQQLTLLTDGARVIYPCYNGETYYLHDDGNTGLELWKTDGTSTSLVVDSDPGPGSDVSGAPLGRYFDFDNSSSRTKMLADYGGSLFYWTNYYSWSSSPNGLWNIDGTVVTSLIPYGQIQDAEFLGGSSNYGYFYGSQQSTGKDIYVSDGSVVTSLDVAPGTSSLSSAHCVNFNNELLISTYENNIPSGGKIFFSNNGTLQQIFSSTSATELLQEFNNKVYLRTNDGVNGWGIYSTDGITVQYEYPMNIQGPLYSKIFNNELFFIEANGQNIIKTDGVSFSTIPSSDNVYLDFGIATSQNGLILWREDPITGIEPYCLNNSSFSLITEHETGTDPSASNFYSYYTYTVILNGAPVVGRLSSQYKNLVEYNGEVFYRIDTGNGFELWKTDGLTTEKLLNTQGTVSGFKYDLTIAGGYLYFINETNQGNQLFRYNTSIVEAVDTSPVEPDSLVVGCTGDLLIYDDNYNLYSYRSTNELEEESMHFNISFFPNPARNKVEIAFGTEGTVEVNFFDLQGRLVLTVNAVNSNDIIDISKLPSGMYTLQCKLEDNSFSKRLIIE